MSLPGFGSPPAYYFMWILPRNLFSRFCGFLADVRMPSLLLTPLIQLYSRIFGVDLTEAKLQVSDFHTFNEFSWFAFIPVQRWQSSFGERNSDILLSSGLANVRADTEYCSNLGMHPAEARE